MSPFPDVDGGKWQVSAAAGGQPVWSHSGRELFYLSEGRTMIAASFVTQPTFRVANSTTLFELPGGYRTITAGGGDNKDVFPDDQRFLLARGVGSEESPSKLILVQNFFEELKRLVPN